GVLARRKGLGGPASHATISRLQCRDEGSNGTRAHASQSHRRAQTDGIVLDRKRRDEDGNRRRSDLVQRVYRSVSNKPAIRVLARKQLDEITRREVAMEPAIAKSQSVAIANEEANVDAQLKEAVRARSQR